MRLSADADRDEERALTTIEAAVAAGVTLLDTAPSYALSQGDAHHNERLLAKARARFPAADSCAYSDQGGTSAAGDSVGSRRSGPGVARVL